MADPLASDGLLAQVFAWAQRWQVDLTRQWHAVAIDPLESGQAAVWWQMLGGPAAADIHQALLGLAILLALALVAQAALTRLLLRPRLALYTHALRLAETPAAGQGALALWRLPYALASGVLHALPWLAALVVLSILQAQVAWLATAMVDRLAYPAAQAWLLAAAGLVLANLALAPRHAEVRLLSVSNATALTLYRSLTGILVLMAVGLGVAGIIDALGAPANLVTLCSKVVGLVVHLWLIVLVWKTRPHVRAWLSGGSRTEGRWAQWRLWLAQIWPGLATLLIALFWLTWTFSVTDGLIRAANVAGRTALVLLLARVLWIAIAGLLERWQAQLDPVLAAIPVDHLQRYQRLLRSFVLIGIIAATFLGLLYAWGVPVADALHPGSLGRRLLSAVITIALAIVAAIVAWEGLSLALQSRVRRWALAGDTQRAARLRTLVPIIRLLLLVGIGLVVLLTALSQLGVNTTPLLASASIFGLAIGFGSQKLVQDFMTGLFLLLENSMQVGDQVNLAGVSGTVEGLSLRTVRLRAADGSLFLVPYSAVTTVNNFNRGLGLAVIRLALPTDTDPAPLLAVLAEVGQDLREDPQWQELTLGELTILGIEQVNGAIATITAQIRTTDGGRAAVQR
ncbi:MAG: mechanosensitive ion channel domain-containing protein, partial [Pigmentiphaga sp.]